MSFASKFNKGKRFDIDVTGMTSYYKLRTLYNGEGIPHDHVYPVRAIFINSKGKYGDHPQVATDSYFVSLPSHMTDLCKSILADDEAIDTINRGLVGFKIYEYTTPSYSGTCYSVEWLDLANGWKEDDINLPKPDGTKDAVATVTEGEETPFN